MTHPSIIQKIVIRGGDTPPGVRNDIGNLWADHELGNDDYTHTWPQEADKNNPWFGKGKTYAELYPALYAFLVEHGVSEQYPMITYSW